MPVVRSKVSSTVATFPRWMAADVALGHDLIVERERRGTGRVGSTVALIRQIAVYVD